MATEDIQFEEDLGGPMTDEWSYLSVQVGAAVCFHGVLLHVLPWEPAFDGNVARARVPVMYVEELLAELPIDVAAIPGLKGHGLHHDARERRAVRLRSGPARRQHLHQHYNTRTAATEDE